MNFKSIKWRLQIWYGLSLLIVLMGFGFTAYQLEHNRSLRKIDGELQRRADALLTLLRRPPRDGGQFPPPRDQLPGEDSPPDHRPNGPPQDLRIPAQIAGLFDAGDTNGFYYLLIRRDGSEIARSANVPAGQKAIIISSQNSINTIRQPLEVERKLAPSDWPQNAEFDGGSGTSPRMHLNRLFNDASPTMLGNLREIRIETPPGERIVVGRNISPELKEFRLMAIRLALVGGGILVLGLAGGWWLACRALRPIANISKTAGEIAGGDLSKRINSSETESELGQLAGVLNSTFARLEATFAQQKQFTSDAAHELRTPVSVVLTQTQSALTKERSAADYRETLEACQRAAQRMRALIESLLQLARLDAGPEGKPQTRFDLAKLAQDCLAMLQPLADERQIKILSQLAPAACSGDSDRIAQVISNLLTNAVNYNRDGGEIHITTRVENDIAVLIVSDNGPGISAEHLPRIFDRFYRVDTARTASHGRSGLGLAISKAIVEAHGGSIEAMSKIGEGSTFAVRLPLA